MENHKHHDYDAASASAAIGKMPREDQAKAKDEDKDDHVMVLNLPNVAGLHSSAKDAQHVRNFAIWRFPAMEEALLHVQSQEIQTLLPYNGPYPERPGEKNCAYYMRTGLCKYGIACRFNHPAKISQITAPTEKYPERIGQPECQFYLKTGTCKFGATCKYHHPPNIEKLNPIQLNANGYPLRQGEKECPYYMRTGSCKYGQTCKFHHPEPTELPYPVAASALGNGSYISIFLSHPTVLPVQPKWRDRLGSRSPPSKQQQTETTTTIDGSEAVSGCDDYCASPSNSNSDLEKADEQNSACQGQQLQTRSCMVETETVFPERPGEPECQYYLKTGTCKYASNCKYHHPKDRISESSNCTYTDTGLPLRPDQPTCKFYSNYGICKFGPACKFHHPATHPIKS